MGEVQLMGALPHHNMMLVLLFLSLPVMMSAHPHPTWCAGCYQPDTIKMEIVNFAIEDLNTVDPCDYQLIHGERSVHDFQSQVVAGMNYKFVVYVGPQVGDSTCKQMTCEFIVFDPLPGQGEIRVSEENCFDL